MRTKKSKLLLHLFGSMCLMLQGLPVAAVDLSSKTESIKIGFVTSLSGAVAEPGQEMVKGFKLFLDQINYRMAGKTVELFVENDEGRPVVGLNKAQDLIEKKHIDVLSGLLLANVGYMVAPLGDKLKIPVVVTVSGADGLTQRKRSNWVIRPTYAASQAMHPFGDFAYNKLKYRRVVTLGVDYQFGYETVGGFQHSFEAAGGKVVQKIWIPLGFNDYSEFLKKINKDADAVFFVTVGANAVIIQKQYKELGIKLPILGTGSSQDETTLSKQGDEAIGIISAMPYSATLDNAANKKFVQLYRARYHKVPGFYAESGYNSALWISKAVEALNGKIGDKAKFLAALKAVKLTDAPCGDITLDEYNSAILNIYIRKVERRNGQLENKVIYTFPKVSQFWKWNPTEYLMQPEYARDYPPCTYCTEQK